MPPYGERPSRGVACVKDRTVRFRCVMHNTIYDVLRYQEWLETDGDDDWDFFWADTGWIHENLDHMHLQEHQRINHFRNHYELTRKDLLIKNLKRTKKSLEREERAEEAARYDFFPQTYSVPTEYNLFVEEFKRSGGVWIMKPVGKAQGKGIFLFNKLSQISEWKKDHRWSRNDRDREQQAESYIVQRYLDRPYLIGGKKFDLRLYALVTSYAPLKIYLYRAGFARFSNSRFSMKKEDITNNFIHLTNVAIQKTASNYDATTGGKWSVRSLKLYLISRHGEEAVNELFNEIRMLIVRSLLAVQNVIINDKHCFEVYGYDIMIDEDLKPWLIEVNASPSLTADTQSDYNLKFSLLEDVLSIIDMEGDARSRENGDDRDRVGGFDLIWNGNSSHYPTATSLRTLLGCHHDIPYRERNKN